MKVKVQLMAEVLGNFQRARACSAAGGTRTEPAEMGGGGQIRAARVRHETTGPTYRQQRQRAPRLRSRRRASDAFIPTAPAESNASLSERHHSDGQEVPFRCYYCHAWCRVRAAVHAPPLPSELQLRKLARSAASPAIYALFPFCSLVSVLQPSRGGR